MAIERKNEVFGMLQQREVVDAADVARLLSAASETAQSIETRLLQLVRAAARGTVPARDVSAELWGMITELRACYRMLADAEDRRDLGFRTMATLEQMTSRCLWLYRKIQLEEAFYAKLELENKLRSLISREGYVVYQKILCIDDNERVLLAQSDADLKRALLDHS